jgi:hypothetical protein
MAGIWRHDIQTNDNHHNDSQHSNIKKQDTEYKLVVMLSIALLGVKLYHCYVNCRYAEGRYAKCCGAMTFCQLNKIFFTIF